MKVLVDKREIAMALNFGEYPVLKFDMDKQKGSKAKAHSHYSAQNNYLPYRCTLKGYIEDGKQHLYLATECSVLANGFTIGDLEDMAEWANAPLIETNQDVAIAAYSKEFGIKVVWIINAGLVNADYSTACRFELK